MLYNSSVLLHEGQRKLVVRINIWKLGFAALSQDKSAAVRNNYRNVMAVCLCRIM
jgi:hypothetical protein